MRRWGVHSYALLFAVAAAPALAQSQSVDEYITAELERQKIPGLSVAVVRDGEVVKAQGYGYANVEHEAAATAETVYQSGSVGKQFTATLVMMLVEEGRLSLDDRLAEHFDAAPEAWRDVTVRHLLTHTAGISNAIYRNMDMRRDYSRRRAHRADRRAAARLCARRRLELQQCRLRAARDPRGPRDRRSSMASCSGKGSSSR